MGSPMARASLLDRRAQPIKVASDMEGERGLVS